MKASVWRPEAKGRVFFQGLRNKTWVSVGYPIKADRLYEELYDKTKRWTWRGRPTRKVSRLEKLERQESKYVALSRPYLSR